MERSYHTLIFLAQLLVAFVVVVNGYVTSNLEDVIKRLQQSGMSQPQVSGFLVSALLLLTALVITVTLVQPKEPAPQGLSFGFVLSMAGIASNYIAMNRVVHSMNDSGAVLLVGAVTFALVANVSVLLGHLSTWHEKVHLLCAGQAFSIAGVLVVVLPVHLAASALRRSSGHDISVYFLNPPVIAGLLMLPHTIVSYLHPSRERSRAMRATDALVYGGYAMTMVFLVPDTIASVHWFEAFPGRRGAFAAYIVGVYTLAVPLALEALRPKTYDQELRSLGVETLRHVLVLGGVSSAVGLLLSCVALLSSESIDSAGAITVGHLLVGLGLGMVMPLWYLVHERWILPRLIGTSGAPCVAGVTDVV
jgi:hypothetical protein